MPLPTVKKGEDKKKFMDRCLSDEFMNSEFPDNKQRYAVCQNIWDEHLKEDNMNNKLIELKSDSPKEIRSYNFELRANKETPEIVGYSAVFDELSEDLGGFREKIRKGAFSETIQGDDVRALFNHDPNYVLGRTTNETLFLEEDDKGLKIKITPPDTQWARDLIFSVARGDISQMSFGFETLVDEWDESGTIPIRTLVKTKLYDVSLVTYPAYPQTSASVRSPEDIFKSYISERQKISDEEKLSEKQLREKIKQSYYKMKIGLIK